VRGFSSVTDVGSVFELFLFLGGAVTSALSTSDDMMKETTTRLLSLVEGFIVIIGLRPDSSAILSLSV
jgi:hypothetical protein